MDWVGKWLHVETGDAEIAQDVAMHFHVLGWGKSR